MTFNLIFFIRIIICVLIALSTGYTQVNIFERPTERDIPFKGLVVKTLTRNQLDLNGKWTVSFNDGQNSAQISVPSAIDFKGDIIFKKQFELNDAALRNYSYLFVAEGITYESEIYLNGNFILKNPYGYNSIIIPLDENSLTNSNEIQIKLNARLNYTSTIPLRNQIEFNRIYAGITRNIYLMAMPKVFILDAEPLIRVESQSIARIFNKVNITSGNLEQFKESGKNFTVKTTVYSSNNTEEPIAESSSIKFNIDNFQNIPIINEFTVKTPSFWRPDNPNLYIFKTSIFNSDDLVDESIFETGITDVTFSLSKKAFTGYDDEKIKINAVNYVEQSIKYASAQTYKEIEKDLLLIKDNGFNCIRITGKPAHPYVIDACNRIGLFLLEEIPFNNIPPALTGNKEYRKSAYEYAEGMVKRDRGNACILAWGIGNDFNVNDDNSQLYVMGIREIISKIDTRPVYYTSPNISEDKCFDLVDLKGINVFTNDINDIPIISEEIKSLTNSRTGIFISSFGTSTENENKSGFLDKHSTDYQAKFLSDFFVSIPGNSALNVVLSFADWHTERPLNHSLSHDRYMKTEGLYDFYRNPKLSSLYVKKLLLGQSLSKLIEGSSPSYFRDKSFIPVIFGIFISLVFAFFYTRSPRFKEAVTRSFSLLLKSGNFFIYVKEGNLITGTYNFIFATVILSGIAVYFSSLFYLYKENPLWELILGNFISNDSMKIFFTNNLNNPAISIILFIIAGFFAILMVFIVINTISFLLKSRIKIKNVFTVAIWSLYPFIIILPVGIIIYKLASLSTSYVHISLLLFLFFYILSLFRLISGFKFLFEYSFAKSLLYGFLFYLVTAGGLFIYLYFTRLTVSIVSLVISYKL